MERTWKNGLRRLIAFLNICIIIGLLVTDPIKPKAVSSISNMENIDNFDLYVYRANYYLKNGTPANRAIESIKNLSYPSQTIVDALNQNNNSFQKRVEQWKALHYATSPSEILNGKLDEKGYYEAIILSLFVSQSDNSIFLYDQTEKINYEANTVLKNVTAWAEQSDSIEVSKISKNQILSTLSIEEQNAIMEYCGGNFEKNHPSLYNSTKMTSNIKNIFYSSTTIMEALERMSAYTQLCELSQQQKDILKKMYVICPPSNLTLKSALTEVVASMDSYDSAILATLENAAINQGNQVLGVLMDEGWDAVIKSNPYSAAFMTGASVGTFIGDSICNSLFSTDKTIEQYMKMKCLGECNQLMQSVLTEFENIYQKNKTSQNAHNYIEATDTIFAIASLSCDFAKNYGDVIYNDALIGSLVNSGEKIDQFYSTIERTKKDYEAIHQVLTDSYLAELEVEYPEIYNIIMGTEENEWEDFTIQMGTYNGKKITWRCVGSDSNGRLMVSDTVLCNKSYDAAFSGYPNSVRRKYGSNYWENSCIKKWLNTAGKIDWATGAIPSGGNIKGSNNYENEQGFLSCFTDDELKNVKEVKQLTYLNNFDYSLAEGGSSKFVFYVHTLDELFAALSNSGDKWYQFTTEKFFLIGPEQLEMACKNVGKSYMSLEQPYWLRLPCNTGMSYENLAIVKKENVISSAEAYNSEIGIRPAFYLNDSEEATKKPITPTTVPGNTGVPLVTTPQETEKPIIEKPEVTKTPETENPKITATVPLVTTPQETEKPIIERPEVTKTPETENPKITATVPLVTTPSEIEKPVIEKPEVTNTPETEKTETEKTEVTKTPETKNPEMTATPVLEETGTPVSTKPQTSAPKDTTKPHTALPQNTTEAQATIHPGETTKPQATLAAPTMPPTEDDDFSEDFITKIELYSDLDKEEQLRVGDSFNLYADIEPEEFEDTELLWYSNNKKIAVVDKKGNVKCVGAGTVTITVTATDGSGKSASMTFEVKKALGSDNNLSSIKVSQGKLTPAFKKTKKSYSLVLSKNMSKVVIKVKKSDSAAKVKINGKTTEKITVNLKRGQTKKVTIRVVAENGKEQTYQIKVKRKK